MKNFKFMEEIKVDKGSQYFDEDHMRAVDEAALASCGRASAIEEDLLDALDSGTLADAVAAHKYEEKKKNLNPQLRCTCCSCDKCGRGDVAEMYASSFNSVQKSKVKAALNFLTMSYRKLTK